MIAVLSLFILHRISPREPRLEPVQIRFDIFPICLVWGKKKQT